MTISFDYVLHGGTAVLSDTIRSTDIAVLDDHVVAIGEPGSLVGSASEILDVTGQVVVPGGIDAHVHSCWPFLSDVTADNFESSTRAAALGGTTTIIDWAYPRPDMLPSEYIAKRREQADGLAVLDYGLHCILNNARQETLDDLAQVVQMGIPSFKVYLAYKNRGLMVDDGALLAILLRLGEVGGILNVHAENGAIADARTEQMVAEGRTAPADFPDSKPNFVEAEAASRAMTLAEVANCPLYIVHTSARQTIAVGKRARERGQPVVLETCPQYLFLTRSRLRGEDGHLFLCSPPLRQEADNEALWAGLAAGDVATTGTDHCAFTVAQKERDRQDFTHIPNGVPGVETRMPLLYSEGVTHGRLGLRRFVDVTSTNAARTFGLFPRKGVIAPGSDADLTVFDPARSVTLSASTLHMESDWTPYEGVTVSGYPVLTMARGEIVARDGSFVGSNGRGRFLPRTFDRAQLP